jgi:SAM-dependent methyltransferase
MQAQPMKMDRPDAAEKDATVALPHCPLDNAPMKRWHYVPMDLKKGAPNSFAQTYRCPKCDYGQVFPLPAPSDVPEFYRLERYYTHGKDHQSAGATPNLLDKIRVHLAWRADASEPFWVQSLTKRLQPEQRKLCDIGCGAGDIAAAFAEAGYDVTGVEPDPEAIARQNRGKFAAVAGTAEKLPDSLTPGSFDAAMMFHSLEHCLNPTDAVKNVRSLLKPGALFVCEVPNNSARGLTLSGAAWEMFDVPRHLHFFTEKSLCGLLTAAEFEIEAVEYAQYCRQFSNNWIATERALRWALGASKDPALKLPRRNSRLRARWLLASTILAPRRFKYDSVRVIARAI